MNTSFSEQVMTNLSKLPGLRTNKLAGFVLSKEAQEAKILKAQAKRDRKRLKNLSDNFFW
jgi:hypothetical protein